MREVVAEIVKAIPDEERVIALDRVLVSLDKSQILPKNASASGWDSATRDQLNSDSRVRSEGSQRTRDYSSYQGSGGSRSSASTYRPSGGSRGGGGRGGGGRRR